MTERGSVEASDDPRWQRHQRKRTIVGALITFSVPAGIVSGILLGRKYDVCVGIGAAIFVPCLVTLGSGMYLAIRRRRLKLGK